jgi:MFS transporter, PAT family, beta-lactamase induction signal transducer AmpG
LTDRRYAIPALAAVFYFSQGFPFGIVNEAVNLYLSYAKVPLGTIGLVGSVGIVWTFKVLWAPAVDTIGTYRMWIFGALVVLSLSLAALGIVPPASLAFWTALIILVLASATQDIAIDATAIRITPEKLLGLVNSFRVAAYRGAMLVAGGGMGMLAAVTGWRTAFLIAAAVPLVILAILAFAAPHESGTGETRENPFRNLLEWIRRPGALTLLAVILLYRLGDNTMMAMVRPYWVARGFTVAEVGNVTTTLGMICTIAGAFAGGAFIARYGVYRSLVTLGILQMLSNLAYALVATTGAGRPALYGAATIESFCGGLGTAAFLSFLMTICDRESAATEYALLSAIFGIGRTLAIAPNGYLAAALGYAPYYWLTAALALPGLALLPLIRGRLAGAARAEAAAH